MSEEWIVFTIDETTKKPKYIDFFRHMWQAEKYIWDWINEYHKPIWYCHVDGFAELLSYLRLEGDDFTKWMKQGRE